MIWSLMGVAFALAAGLFGAAGIALFCMVAIAAAFLLTMAIGAVEIAAAKFVDVCGGS